MGHVHRMDEERVTRRIMQWKPVRKPNEGNTTEIVSKRTEWKEVVTQPKTHIGL